MLARYLSRGSISGNVNLEHVVNDNIVKIVHNLNLNLPNSEGC